MASVSSEISVDRALGGRGDAANDTEEGTEEDVVEHRHAFLLDGAHRGLPRDNLDARQFCGMGSVFVNHVVRAGCSVRWFEKLCSRWRIVNG